MHVTTVHNRRNEIEVKTKILSVYFGGGGVVLYIIGRRGFPSNRD